MKIEYQITPELSLLVREDGMVEYSLHNRIYPQAYTSSILTLQELEECIKQQIEAFRAIQLISTLPVNIYGRSLEQLKQDIKYYRTYKSLSAVQMEQAWQILDRIAELEKA